MTVKETLAGLAEQAGPTLEAMEQATDTLNKGLDTICALFEAAELEKHRRSKQVRALTVALERILTHFIPVSVHTYDLRDILEGKQYSPLLKRWLNRGKKCK